RVERRSPRMTPGKARRACILRRSSFLKNTGSRRLCLLSLIVVINSCDQTNAQLSLGIAVSMYRDFFIGVERIQYIIKDRVGIYVIRFAFEIKDDTMPQRRFGYGDNVCRANIIAA